MKKSSIILSRLSAGALSAALLCGGIFAGATVATKTMTASYNDVKITLNGIAVTPTDADGKVVEPFIVDGTTYLPIRAIANAMGLDVEWDGATKTVRLGEDPNQGTNWMTKLPPYQVGGDTNAYYNEASIYDGSDPKSYFTVSGVDHLAGVTFMHTSTLSSTFSAYAMWNTNMDYGAMTFTLGNLDGYQQDATMEIYLNGEYSGISYELHWDDPPKTYTIPLNYAASVKVVLTASSRNQAGYGMYDISFS